MQARRILVLGSSGSGKSTFARRLGDITGLPVVHLDRLYLKPGWVASAREAFYPLVRDALSKDVWIMDGNYGRTLPMRLPYCDQVFYFDLPRLLCMWGITVRVLKNYGKSRPDIGNGCPERFNWEFVKSTWNFKKNQGDKVKELIFSSGKPVVVFRSRGEAGKYVRVHGYDKT